MGKLNYVNEHSNDISQSLFLYDPKLLYDRSIDLSFRSQKNDMILRDSTDIYGWLKIRSLYPEGLTIKYPYIFKVSKGVQSFIALGTMHALPLEVFPKVLRDILLSNTLLVVEPYNEEYMQGSGSSSQNLSIADSDFESEADRQIDQSLANYTEQSPMPAEWFEELPTRLQICFDDMYGIVPTEENRPADVMAYMDYVTSEYGMDSYLMNLYPKFEGLESYNECLEDALGQSDQEILSEIVQELECTLLYGGYFAYPGHISDIADYVSGNKLALEEYDYYVHKRNDNWGARFEKIMGDNLESKILLAVGISHLFGEGGFLTAKSIEGWTIERADLVGEFHFVDLSEFCF